MVGKIVIIVFVVFCGCSDGGLNVEISEFGRTEQALTACSPITLTSTQSVPLVTRNLSSPIQFILPSFYSGSTDVTFGFDATQCRYERPPNSSIRVPRCKIGSTVLGNLGGQTISASTKLTFNASVLFFASFRVTPLGPLVACDGVLCGSVGDGCGNMLSCVCSGGAQCGLGGASKCGCVQPIPPYNDNNPCTVDSCNASGLSVHTPVAVGTNCDDTLYCNGINTCNALGQCVPGVLAGLDDNNKCTTDGCSEQTRTISHTPVAAGTPCDDQTVCNGSEICSSAGVCLPGIALNPNDANVCTQDACDPILGVQHTPLSAPPCYVGCLANTAIEQGDFAQNDAAYRSLVSSAITSMRSAGVEGANLVSP